MSIQPAILEKLTEFKTRNKFSADKWEERGLIPSDEALCLALQQQFDTTSKTLISAVSAGKTLKSLKAVLKKELNSFEIEDYDTEEKEFIADLFFELAGITGIEDFGKVLEKWMYRDILNVSKSVNKNEAKEIRSQTCSKCGVLLETYITEVNDAIPETAWFLGMCKNCNGPNLIKLGGGVKSFAAGNYMLLGNLEKKEYTLEQATVLVEQMKNLKI